MTAKWCVGFVAAWTIVAAVLMPAAGCGKKRKGGPTIKELIEKAEMEGSPDRQAAALLKVARMQYALGVKEGARETVKLAYTKVAGEGDANQLAPRLVETAAVALLVSDKRTAGEALNEAVKNADKVEDASRQAKVYADAGALFGDKRKGLGDAKQAKKWLAKATQVAETVEERFRAEALGAVALGYSNSGMGTEAAEMVQKLKDCAAALEEPRAKAEALAAAASVQARNGNNEDAATLLTDASAAAKSVERSESRAYALLAVAEAMILNDDKKTARALLKEAEKAADKVSDAELRQMAMDKVRAAIKVVEKK